MNKTNALSIAIVSLLLILVVIQQSVPVTARISLPYKEGDWFKYRIEVRVDGERCWQELEVRILEIDTDNMYVRAMIKPLNSGGTGSYCQALISLRETVETFDLRASYNAREVLIDPSISGTYKIGDGETVVYDKGVLREAKFSMNLFGYKVEGSLRLVDSSVLAYKPWLTWLIVILVIVVIAVVIVVVIRKFRKKVKTLTVEQYPPSPELQTPQSPQPAGV